MIEAEENKYLSHITSDAKDEKLTKKKLKIYYFPLLKIEIKKVEIFKKQLKSLKMMKTINLFIH